MWKTELTIGEVAARTGVAVSALRFYEERGLITSRRNEGNQRRYARDVLRRVSVIKVAQRLGLSLDEIHDAFDALPEHGVARGPDWQRLSERWRAELDDRIAGLTRLRDQLSDCIGCGCLSLEMCPLRNRGDQLGAEGPGARLLE